VVVRAGIVERSRDEAVVCVWGGSKGGVDVLKSWGERMALLNMSGTGVYGMKSQADLVCDGEGKCRMATPRRRNGKSHRVSSRENAS
jgi:hypothetical protein